MLVVGLTGGIGCGKSAVAGIFEQDFRVPVIDADVIARQLTETDEIRERLYRAIGDKYFDAQRTLLRDRLRRAVFADAGLRRTLEDLLHPLIYREIRQRLGRLDAAYCIVVVPLLLETEGAGLADRILVIDCNVEQQLERVMARDRCDPAHAKAIISAQLDRDARLARADDVLENDNGLESLREKVAILHDRYSTLGHPPDVS